MVYVVVEMNEHVDGIKCIVGIAHDMATALEMAAANETYEWRPPATYVDATWWHDVVPMEVR